MPEKRDNWAIVYTGIGKTEVRKAKMPQIGDDDLLICVRATALCSQEQRMFKGQRKVIGYPCVAGHESAGEVVMTGKNVRDFRPGDHVAFGASPYIPPEGYPEKRDDGIYVEEYGSLTGYLKIREDRCYKAERREVPFEKLCFAEPVSCAAASVKRAAVGFGDYVLIIGAGIMGLLHLQLCRKRGAIVIVSEPDERRRKKAAEMGADYLIDPLNEELSSAMRKITEEGADAIINTTPFPDSWACLPEILAPYGRLVAYSSQHPDEPVGIRLGRLHSNNQQIIGTVDGREEMKAAVRMIEHDIIDVSALTSAVYEYQEAQKAFEKGVSGSYRVVIVNRDPINGKDPDNRES